MEVCDEIDEFNSYGMEDEPNELRRRSVGDLQPPDREIENRKGEIMENAKSEFLLSYQTPTMIIITVFQAIFSISQTNTPRGCCLYTRDGARELYFYCV